MTGKQMIKLYKKYGWKVMRVKGSHYTMKKGSHKTAIPHHTTELRKGMEKALLKKIMEVG